MSKTIIDTGEEADLKKASSQGHGFFFIDKLLQAKTDGYVVQVTLGWTTPGSTYAPVGTVSMPAPFAKELADALLAAFETSKRKRAP